MNVPWEALYAGMRVCNFIGQRWAIHFSSPTTRTTQAALPAPNLGCSAVVELTSRRFSSRPSQQAAYQATFSANRISLAVVVVEVSKPATPVGAPLESKMSVLPGL